MKTRLVLVAFGFLLAIAGLPLTGCTLIGYAIGSSIDQGNPRVEAPVPSVTEMEDGDLYRVVKIDSSVVYGKYVGSLPGELYDEWRGADDSRSNLPRYRDSVEIILDTPTPRSLYGRFTCLSADSLWVVDHGWPRPPTRTISLQYVRALTSTTGGRIEGPDLRTKAAGMPARIGIDVVGRMVYVPIDSIAHLSSMDIPSSARWLGMFLGVAVDAVVVAVIVNQFAHWRWGGE